MDEKKKGLRWYHGILVFLLSGAVLFLIGPMMAQVFGLIGEKSLYATLLAQLLLLAVAIGVAMMAGNPLRTLKEAFPIHRPKLRMMLGAVLFWYAAWKLATTVNGWMLYFYPEEMMGVSGELDQLFLSVPFLTSFLIVALLPAICEEAVFRGVALQSFRCQKCKWIGIFITGLVFGLFHGTVFRLPGTMILGVVFAYVVVETENILYSSLMHLINNGYSVITLFLSSLLQRADIGIEESAVTVGSGVSLSVVGIYMLQAVGVPLLFYIASYLIHEKKEPLFAKEKKKQWWLLIGISGVLLLISIGIIAIGFLRDMTVWFAC